MKDRNTAREASRCTNRMTLLAKLFYLFLVFDVYEFGKAFVLLFFTLLH
jgi:hypothetical protein